MSKQVLQRIANKDMKECIKLQESNIFVDSAVIRRPASIILLYRLVLRSYANPLTFQGIFNLTNRKQIEMQN